MFGLPGGVTACLFDMDGVFLAAATELHEPPGRAAVFEDALAGGEAGRACHFALVVGVDRVGQAEELSKHGADIVVRDLAELLDVGGQPGEGVR